MYTARFGVELQNEQGLGLAPAPQHPCLHNNFLAESSLSCPPFNFSQGLEAWELHLPDSVPAGFRCGLGGREARL